MSSSISTHIYQTVTIGPAKAAHYSNPLTITSTGEVAPTAVGAVGVDSATGLPSLTIDLGVVIGGPGSFTDGGGIGVELSHANVTNAGYIYGGQGGITGGGGGIGVDLTDSTLANKLEIYGGSVSDGNGSGGAGVYLSNGTSYSFGFITGGASAYGAGGDGLDLTAGAQFTNFGSNTVAGGGTITGGHGHSVGGTGVALTAGAELTNGHYTLDAFNIPAQITGGTGDIVGGVGVTASGTDTSVTNNYFITGGAGGVTGGVGAGVYSNAYLNNTGEIYGGEGKNGTGGTGVQLSSGASATNSGFMGGGNYDGGNGGVGVDLTSNATLTNTYGGHIFGGVGAAGGAAAEVGSGSTLTNNYGAYITGMLAAPGVDLVGGTLIDSGIIAGLKGATGDSVYFSPAVDSTMELSSGAILAGDIGGFAIGDTIDVANLTPTEVAADFGATAVYLSPGVYGFNGSSSGETFKSSNYGTLNLSGDFSGEHFVLTPDGTAITLAAGTLPCYCRGTLIRTAKGETPVEHLAVGDLVLTAKGESRPIRWLGSRGIDCSRYPNPAVIWPIRIQAGAFAVGLPARDLWVSPGHSMLIDGVLIQAEKLVNGATIVQVPRQRIEYWHVELESHDIILAEGLPAESYLDTGNRTGFVNGGAYLEAYPDFKPKHWADTCMPLALEGPAVQSAKAALLARARALGYGMTEEADVHVVADGKRVEPVRLGERRLAFMLPAAASSIELRCRSFTPAHVDPASNDQRSLGICVGRLQLDGIDVVLENDAAFTMGWHTLEQSSDGHPWRWSHDRASLPAAIRLVVIDLRLPGQYWAEPTDSVIALFG